MRLAGLLPLARIQAVLNRGLAESTLASRKAAALEGRSLEVRLSDSPVGGVLCIEQGQLRLRLAEPGAGERGATGDAPAGAGAGERIDATISGGGASLLSLTGPRRDELLRAGAVRIDGDAEIAAAFSDLLALIRPDVEQELSRLIGFGPAHVLAVAGQRARQWLGGLARRNVDNSLEFLAHERKLLVPRAEAEHQRREVESLRDRLARLEARLDRLPAANGARDGANR